MADEYRFTLEEAKMIGDILGIDWTNVSWTVEEFQKGLEVELEHGLHDPQTNITSDDPYMTGKIAWAHLKELPDYYQKLAGIEGAVDRYEAASTVLLKRDLDATISAASGDLKKLLQELSAILDKYSEEFGSISYAETLEDLERIIRIGIAALPQIEDTAARLAMTTAASVVNLLVLVVGTALKTLVSGVPFVGGLVGSALDLVLRLVTGFVIAFLAALITVANDNINLQPLAEKILKALLDIVERAQTGQLTGAAAELAKLINMVVLHNPATGKPRVVVDAIQLGLALTVDMIDLAAEIADAIDDAIEDAQPENPTILQQLLRAFLAELF